MYCSRCGTLNKAENEFCSTCRAPYEVRCALCGNISPIQDELCSMCGAQIGRFSTRTNLLGTVVPLSDAAPSYELKHQRDARYNLGLLLSDTPQLDEVKQVNSAHPDRKSTTRYAESRDKRAPRPAQDIPASYAPIARNLAFEPAVPAQSKRTHWRVSFLSLTRTLGLAVIFLVILIGWFARPVANNPVSVQLDASPPSLAELDAALVRSDHYLTSLYKPIDDVRAAEAEYPGFPLRVYLPAYGRWILAGENEKTLCRGAVCSTTTEISDVHNEYSRESFRIEFRSPLSGKSPLLRVEINWDQDTRQYGVVITNEQFDDHQTTAQLFLYDYYIGTFSPSNVGKSTALVFDKSDTTRLHTFRYTIRHGSQDAQNYYWYKNEIDRFQKLVKFETEWGFPVDFDVHAPVWGHGSMYPDDMPYMLDESNDEDVYHDCNVSTTKNNLNYPYESKICRVGTPIYVMISSTDTLIPTVQAIHIMNKYHDPNHVYADFLGRNRTPMQMATDIEKIFDASGIGVPMCTPIGCKSNLVSAIRTFEFGALETLLGYDYGLASSRWYADRIARIAIQVQVGDNSVIHTVDHGDFYRPAQKGGFYLSWDQSFRFRENKPWVYRQLDELLNMPAEYNGMLVSNMETTHDAYAFLTLYRCKKYGVGCAPSVAKPVLSADVTKTPPTLRKTILSLFNGSSFLFLHEK